MRTVLIASLLSAFCALPAHAATRTYPVGGFDRIRSAVPFVVRVHTGAPAAVHAVGDDRTLAGLRVGVRNGELVVDAQHPRWFQRIGWRKGSKVLINVTLPHLVGVALDGPGDLVVDTVRGPGFSAALAGPGNLSIGAIDVGHASVTLNGPGDIALAGRSGSAQIVGRGPGDVRAAGWSVDDVTVDLMGPGDVALTALRTATVHVAGPGDVRIGGHPRCQVTKRGPGRVVCG